MITVSDRIRGKSAERHVKTRDWAKLFRVSERTWQRWLNNPDCISLGQIKVIANYLGVEVGELIGGKDDD